MRATSTFDMTCGSIDSSCAHCVKAILFLFVAFFSKHLIVQEPLWVAFVLTAGIVLVVAFDSVLSYAGRSVRPTRCMVPCCAVGRDAATRHGTHRGAMGEDELQQERAARSTVLVGVKTLGNVYVGGILDILEHSDYPVYPFPRLRGGMVPTGGGLDVSGSPLSPEGGIGASPPPPPIGGGLTPFVPIRVEQVLRDRERSW